MVGKWPRRWQILWVTVFWKKPSSNLAFPLLFLMCKTTLCFFLLLQKQRSGSLDGKADVSASWQICKRSAASDQEQQEKAADVGKMHVWFSGTENQDQLVENPFRVVGLRILAGLKLNRLGRPTCKPAAKAFKTENPQQTRLKSEASTGKTCMETMKAGWRKGRVNFRSSSLLDFCRFPNNINKTWENNEAVKKTNKKPTMYVQG